MLGIVALVAVVGLALASCKRDSEPKQTQATVTAAAVTFPYDFHETAAQPDFKLLSQATFLSLLLPTEAGSFTSYGLSSELPEVQALIAALQRARPVTDESSSGPQKEGTPGADAPPPSASEQHATLGAASPETFGGPMLTFVLPGREILTFQLDPAAGTLTRGEWTWQVATELRQLLESVTRAR